MFLQNPHHEYSSTQEDIRVEAENISTELAQVTAKLGQLITSLRDITERMNQLECRIGQVQRGETSGIAVQTMENRSEHPLQKRTKEKRGFKALFGDQTVETKTK